MIDKNAQRLAAAKFEKEQLAKGAKRPEPKMVPFVQPKKPVSPEPKSKTVSEPAALNNNGLQTIWMNTIGQTLIAGDPVIIVSTGYNHRVNVRVGKFLGAKIKNGKITSVSCFVKRKKYTKNYGYQDYESRQSFPSMRVYKIDI